MAGKPLNRLKILLASGPRAADRSNAVEDETTEAVEEVEEEEVVQDANPRKKQKHRHGLCKPASHA